MPLTDADLQELWEQALHDATSPSMVTREAANRVVTLVGELRIARAYRPVVQQAAFRAGMDAILASPAATKDSLWEAYKKGVEADNA